MCALSDLGDYAGFGFKFYLPRFRLESGTSLANASTLSVLVALSRISTFTVRHR